METLTTTQAIGFVSGLVFMLLLMLALLRLFSAIAKGELRDTRQEKKQEKARRKKLYGLDRVHTDDDDIGNDGFRYY